VQCGVCGAESPAGKKFCVKCGSPLAAVCPTCASPIDPSDVFCGECGTALTGVPATTTAAAAPAVPPQAERRVCSVLFCDLVGFTPLSEARDPEEVRELLSRYFELAGTVVRRYGGVVEKFIGDAVMAVWGTPVATEGDAERAVRAAMDLMDTVRQLGVEAEVPSLAARAGVVTGEVAVTIGATNEGMVAGDAVNTAARVQSVAGHGQVLVDSTTRRLAANAIAFDDPVEQPLKGKAAPEQLWRATRVMSGGVGGVQRVDGLEAPLTGRDAEMRTIRELFHAAVDRRTPRLVLVSGPAGVGKSRLGWEFRKYIDGLIDIVRWHSGRCLSYGEGVSFWALAEIVRQRLGIAEEDLPETAAAKLEEGLATWITDPVEQPYVGARLARLLGVAYAGDTGGELARDELFAGWRLFFERMAAVEPVVLMIEDAHHADSGLLDFLDHLVDWVRDLPMYVLVFARSELEQTRPGFGTGRNRVALTLDPLDDASMRPLVEALVPGLPTGVREAIVAQAQGVPLFAVETVRALIDRDVVQPVEGVYRLVGDVGDLEVPDSLHALLAARLDALPSDTRRLVSDAAVLGTSFPADAVVAVSGLDASTVREGLGELLRREVLTVSADPLSPERGSYRFAQDMLRQVAYETLSRRDRKARHLAVAAHLRGAFANDGEEVVDVIAQHYLDALAAVPGDPDEGEIREQAVVSLTRTAERAARTGAPGRAGRSYAAAAGLLDGGDDVGRAAELWEKAAQWSMAGGDARTTLDHAAAAVVRYQKLGDECAAARTQRHLGRALRRLGRITEAREVLTGAVETLRDDPTVNTMLTLAELAAVENFAGNVPAADRLTSELLLMGEGLGAGPDQMSTAFLSRGTFQTMGGRPAEAAVSFRESVRLAELANRSDLAGYGLANLANVVGMKDPADALDVTRRAVEPLRRAADRMMIATNYGNMVMALLELGEWDEVAELLGPNGDAVALADVEEHIRLAQAQLAGLRGDAESAEELAATLTTYRGSEDPQDLAAVAVIDALASAAAGRPAETLSHAKIALSHCDEGLGVGSDLIRWAWVTAARAAYEVGDQDSIAELLTMVEDEMPGRLPPMLRAELDLVRARIAVAAGTPDAGEQLDAAVVVMRLMSPPHLLAGGLLDRAEYLIGAGDVMAAAIDVADAQAIGERLGCRPLLDRAAALSVDRLPV
jgi:class 3 adenylate cyclase/tetratricopeptide (TPR) repeat protein